MEKKASFNGIEAMDFGSINKVINAIIKESEIGDEFSFGDKKIWKVVEKKDDCLVLVLENKKPTKCDKCHREGLEPYPAFGPDAYKCPHCSAIVMAKKASMHKTLSSFDNLSLKRKIDTRKRLANLQRFEESVL